MKEVLLLLIILLLLLIIAGDPPSYPSGSIITIPTFLHCRGHYSGKGPVDGPGPARPGPCSVGVDEGGVEDGLGGGAAVADDVQNDAPVNARAQTRASDVRARTQGARMHACTRAHT